MEYTKYKDISNESYIFLEIGWQLLTAINRGTVAVASHIQK